MFLPLLLLLLAMASAAVIAYGTHHVWAQYPHGVEFIIWAREFRWPLAAVSVILCLVVIGLVIAGKRRAWWLVGLGPVLALYLHAFHRSPYRDLVVLDDPQLLSAAEATNLSDSDWVVGLRFADEYHAYPLNRLYLAPVIFKSDQTKRMVLIWSAYANRALAFNIAHDLRARDIEIVSMPANALLLYNSKLGQFFDGVSGLTRKGRKPTGFGSPIELQKMTWGQWRALHPQTRVLCFDSASFSLLKAQPLEPSLPMPKLKVDSPGTRVVVLGTTRPAALPAEKIGPKPVNIAVGDMRVVIFRHPRTGVAVAFDRRVDQDLFPRFELNLDRARKGYLFDPDNRITWSAEGIALEGELGKTGARLKPIPVDEGLYWGVLKFWMPQLEWIEPPH